MNPKDIEILRKRQSESEDRLDRSWMPEKGQRVLRGGNIHYEISDRVRAVDCGGLGVIQLLVKQLELAETIDQRVKVLERHLPYRESDHVLNLIYNVMTGGSCLQDVEARRRRLFISSVSHVGQTPTSPKPARACAEEAHRSRSRPH